MNLKLKLMIANRLLPANGLRPTTPSLSEEDDYQAITHGRPDHQGEIDAARGIVGEKKESAQ